MDSATAVRNAPLIGYAACGKVLLARRLLGDYNGVRTVAFAGRVVPAAFLMVFVRGDKTVAKSDDIPKFDDIPEFDDFDLPGDSLESSDPIPPLEGDGIEPLEDLAPTDELAGLEAGALPDGLADIDAATDDFGGPMPVGDLGGDALADDASQDDSDKKSKPDKDKDKDKKSGLLGKVFAASPYTVMLAISLAAISVSILCLILELVSYL